MVGFLGFLESFLGFLFFFALLKDDNIRLFVVVLGFLWGVCFEGRVYV